MTTVNIPAIAQRSRPVVQISDGQAITVSTEVARVFGKQHKDVLRSIQNLLSELGEGYQRNFAQASVEVQQPNGGTAKYPAYHLTRDGFTLLAMGFTGKRALAFKLAYIDAFNKMEAALAGKAQPDHIAEASKKVPPPASDHMEEVRAMVPPPTPALDAAQVNTLISAATEGILQRLEAQCVVIHWRQVITAIKHESTEMSFSDLTDLTQACLKRLQRVIGAESYAAIEKRAANQNQTTATVPLHA